MNEQDMLIAFPNGGRLPVGTVGNAKEISVPAHEPVRVPLSYGEHLVADRFAYRASEPKKAPAGKLDK